MGRVAEMYAQGIGTARNPIEAYFWAILAERSSVVRGDAVARPAAETRVAELGEGLSAADRSETRARAEVWRPRRGAPASPDNV
jgi:TPR repeat protein